MLIALADASCSFRWHELIASVPANDRNLATTEPLTHRAIGGDGTSWNANPNKLKKAVEKNTSVAVGADVLASGGLYSGSPGSTEEQYSTQSTTDASLGAFNGATGSNTISGTTGGYSFFNQSAALYVDPAGNPHVMILGGQTVGTIPTAVQSGVWYMNSFGPHASGAGLCCGP